MEESPNCPDRTFFGPRCSPRGGPRGEETSEAPHASVGPGRGEAPKCFGAPLSGTVADVCTTSGKYSEAFQEYLSDSIRTGTFTNADALPLNDHSTAGSQHAAKPFSAAGSPHCLVIRWPPAGIPTLEASGTCLRKRLLKPVEPWGAAPARILDLPSPTPPPFLLKHLGAPARREGQFGLAFFTRMLYSALVDADFLDTEAFMDPARASERGEWPGRVLRRMLDAVEAHLTGFGEREGGW